MSFEKILIVEDELVVRNLLQSIFQRHKLPVTCANNLTEAAAIDAHMGTLCGGGATSHGPARQGGGHSNPALTTSS